MEATPMSMSKPSKTPGNVPSDNGGSAGESSESDSSTNSKQAAPKWLGKRLGRFRLQALIGQGAMGRVFRADDTTLQRRVALKIISLYDRSGQINPFAERFVNEARAAAALEHPHIVQIYEAGEAGKVCYIAMELVEGGSLAELVDASGPMDLHRACQLTAEAGEALAAAHAVGVIHRDVKPANLMLSRHGRCKVTDFGLAMFEGDITEAGITERNRRVGTALFVAPEVIRGVCADEMSDMYSLGATLFYLLTGRPPYVAEGRADTMRAHLEQPVPDVRAFRPEVPTGLVQAITRVLDKDPGRRFSSMAQFARLLRVYTIPITAPVAAHAAAPGTLAPMQDYSAAPSQLSSTSGMGISGGMGAGLSGSFSSSSGALSGLGSTGSVRSFAANDSKRSSGQLPVTPAMSNRMAAMDHLTALAEAAASVDHIAALAAEAAAAGQRADASYPAGQASAIPTATIVHQHKRFLGLPMAAWGGIAAGVVIAVIAVAWVEVHNAQVSRELAATAQPAPASGEAMLAAEKEEPTTPVVSPSTPPAAVTAAAPKAAVPTSPPAAVPPKALPKVSVPSTSPSTFIPTPPGVLHPWDVDALRLIADGKDPAHPDKTAIIQGRIVTAAQSESGKTFHIRFQKPGGPIEFEVVYFQSNGMFEMMDSTFNGDVAKTLIGRMVRISGKLRVYETTVQMVPSSPNQFVVLDKP
jgi:serine/threonine protein kinase